ncbi:cation:proton antiporter [Streptomyces sp. TBY4]|uniref:cation:proton antiporter n=1 Tax=Streptomyces sp. TBY4 TaxID=2962030 RepID=UPI0020B74307|nr:cation:proton antiporter [Streptomyces sp. TBY4]MCP3757016.1 cation:proton antiporter [Streptomyces sp. TBY4]
MTADTTAVLFLALALVLGVAGVCGAAARRLGQPAVVGEILAGVLLGSTVLSQTWGGLGTGPYERAQPLLGALANVGLALFMFVIGHELDPAFARRSGRTVLWVAAGAVLLPLGGGVLVALPYAEEHGPAGPLGFTLFIGVALSVTAFPVLARILSDQKLNHSRVGRIAMAAAGVNDLVAWSCLAVIAALLGTGEAWRLAFLPVYLGLLTGMVRPLMAGVLRRRARDGAEAGATGAVMVTTALMASCAATEWMGVHFAFGAFALGAVMPRAQGGGAAAARPSVFEDLANSAGHLLLPVYFVIAGTRVDLTAFRAVDLGALAVMSAVAVGTKMAGTRVGAALGGLPRREARMLAVLMNTRGLTEVVILTLGLNLGFIDRSFYAILVVVAILTTVMTGPLLRVRRVRPPDPVPGSAGAPPSGEGLVAGRGTATGPEAPGGARGGKEVERGAP